MPIPNLLFVVSVGAVSWVVISGIAGAGFFSLAGAGGGGGGAGIKIGGACGFCSGKNNGIEIPVPVLEGSGKVSLTVGPTFLMITELGKGVAWDAAGGAGLGLGANGVVVKPWNAAGGAGVGANGVVVKPWNAAGGVAGDAGMGANGVMVKPWNGAGAGAELLLPIELYSFVFAFNHVLGFFSVACQLPSICNAKEKRNTTSS